MSNLSSREVSAGISRKALEAATHASTNGNGKAHPATATQKAANWQTISAVRETSVIDTPMRKLSVLEALSGYVTIRDTQFLNSRADVTHIVMEPEAGPRARRRSLKTGNRSIGRRGNVG